MADPLAPDARLSERVYHQLLDMILRRDLPLGSVLHERRISEMLKVSRTPAREALNRLKSEGIVVREAGRTLVLRGLSTRELIEALNVRRLLEGEAAFHAAGKIPAGDLLAIEEAICPLLAKPAPRPDEDWAIDNMLHGAIADHAGNALLARMIADLRFKTHMFNVERIPERFRIGHGEHLEIISALRRGEQAEARCLVETHIENVKKSIIALLAAI